MNLDYKDLPAFKYGHIIESHIESIEFDNNLLRISDAEDDSDENNDFDPLYNHFLTAPMPTASDFQSFCSIANTQVPPQETSTYELPKPVLSQSEPALKINRSSQELKPQPIKEVSTSATTIKEFFKSQKPTTQVVPIERVPAVVERDWNTLSPKQAKRIEAPPRKESPKQFGSRGRREPKPGEPIGFLTAKDAMIDDLKKNCQTAAEVKTTMRHLGLKKPAATNKFQSPLVTDESSSKAKSEPVDAKLKGIDEKLLERIKNDVIESGSSMSWDDIKGLELAKRVIQETIIFPTLRPDLFTGLRRPPKGVLLFGPPGNGKTLIAKCIASTAAAMFFNISASSLTSKWIGEGEMLVRALFTYARINQPAVVFIDEVDSLLSRRSENEHESSRRLKTEFLVFLDGAGTGEDERILIIGATNRPQELDEAVRRRFTKRLYIPLPNQEARRDIISHHLKSIVHELSDEEINQLAKDSNGYSGADIKSLAQEASMIPMREIMESAGFSALQSLKKGDIPPVGYRHFTKALDQTKPSVSKDDINDYVDWNKKYGSG